jgi:ribosome-binding protein aMBF1 (putative translation factor)
LFACVKIGKKLALRKMLNQKHLQRARKKLPDRNTQQTFSNVITEYIPYYYVWRNKRQALEFGEKPSSLPQRKVVTLRDLRKDRIRESYVNPIERAREYLKMMQTEGLTQSQLAPKLGVSRVRVTQLLNLLKLNPRIQEEVLLRENGFTERHLRPLTHLQDHAQQSLVFDKMRLCDKKT